VNKDDWRGVAVYIEIEDGIIHPVSLELIGKARELAEESGMPVLAVAIGSGIKNCVQELKYYGVDKVCCYDNESLAFLLPEPYTSVIEDFILAEKPSVLLMGATTWGRSLAPRVAARMKTGLTADCTKLEIKPNSDLVQIRPAFGGNVMAQIVTPNHRPQLATVRYRVFAAPERMSEATGDIVFKTVKDSLFKSGVEVLEQHRKEQQASISDAEIIVAVGRGVKSQRDIVLFEEFAKLIGGRLACSRPLAEAGWVEQSCQVGLSGRTVKPRLFIALGISGAVQFKAGMENSDYIISINQDENAPIFQISNIAAVGDIYEIVAKLSEKLKNGRASDV